VTACCIPVLGVQLHVSHAYIYRVLNTVLRAPGVSEVRSIRPSALKEIPHERPVLGSCEHGNKNSGSIKCGEFFA
jgi:hypothetical protein